eukprot:6197880-Pleurochrysis_carterae.AAC.2
MRFHPDESAWDGRCGETPQAEHARLASMCAAYDCVVEVLRADRIKVVHIPYTALDGHVVFESGSWREGEQLYASFYEYTGRVGCIAASATDGGDEPTDVSAHGSSPAPPPSSSTLGLSSDGVCEGVTHLFYTEERFRQSLLNVTSDDIGQGQRALAREMPWRTSSLACARPSPRARTIWARWTPSRCWSAVS